MSLTVQMDQSQVALMNSRVQERLRAVSYFASLRSEPGTEFWMFSQDIPLGIMPMRDEDKYSVTLSGNGESNDNAAALLNSFLEQQNFGRRTIFRQLYLNQIKKLE